MDLDADDLLRILLILAIIWIALEIVTGVLKLITGFFFGLLKPLLGILIIGLIILWLVDRL